MCEVARGSGLVCLVLLASNNHLRQLFNAPDVFSGMIQPALVVSDEMLYGSFRA